MHVRQNCFLSEYWGPVHGRCDGMIYDSTFLVHMVIRFSP